MTKPIFQLLFFLSLFQINVFAQEFTNEELLQGYKIVDDQVYFVFDEKLYQVEADRVFVTGEFRDWDQNLENKSWELKKSGDTWQLLVENFENRIIKPNTGFKFRINDGEWLNPPELAINTTSGNLVFMKKDDSIYLKAELRKNNLIWAEIGPERTLDRKDYMISDVNGHQIEVAKVLPNESKTVLVIPATPLDIKKIYYLRYIPLDLQTHCSFDGWFRELYSNKPLGANVENGKTDIRIFAPRAEEVKLYLYQEREAANADRTINLVQDDHGVWEASFDEDLHGVYYDFTIHGADQPGNHFYETNPVHINDPYARVSDDTWGKARIWRKTEPAKPLKNGIPALEQVVAYEVHVQDFTDLLPISEETKGTFKGMITQGLTNSHGRKIGFDHILDLGVNVVHLMPVQEYVHFPDDDWKASFKDDPYMIEQGISEENYQWGYRTSFAMAVESRYRTKGKEPGAEREEFRDLVQAFHDEDIAVIIDIVPNHTAENMTDNEWYFNFNAIDKQYYYRTKDFKHIGEYGNEVKTENRPMAQRWLIDQCKYFIDEFGIDGFRIDLAGQIDKQTLIALKQELGHDKIIYGEAWIASRDPEFEANPDWDWYKEDAPICFFQDDTRNAYKGSVFTLESKENDRGWAGGKFNERYHVTLGLANRFADDKTPLSGISYLDIHDNFTLADQFGSYDFDGRLSVDQRQYKIAATLLYTTLGPIVTHGGSEFMRSKAHAPLKEVVKTTKAGHIQYMHGKRDSYNHRKANQFIWEQVGQRPIGENKNDYANMYDFWRGLNQLRLSDLGKIFSVSYAVPDDYYQWILPPDESLLGYVIDDQMMVLINASNESKTFQHVTLPQGNWQLIGNINEVNHIQGVDAPANISDLKFGQTNDIELAGQSLFIWSKK